MKMLISCLILVEVLHLVCCFTLVGFALDFRRMIRKELYEFEQTIKVKINAFLDVFKRSGRRERE